MNPPKTHDLNEIRRLCLDLSEAFGDVADHCSDLTAFGVQPRYPMEVVLEEHDIQQALNSARAVQNLVLRIVTDLASRGDPS